jgi:hypothetical protein
MAQHLPSQRSATWAKARIPLPPSSTRVDSKFLDLVALVDHPHLIGSPRDVDVDVDDA